MVFSSRFFYEWVIELFNMADEEYDLIPACGNGIQCVSVAPFSHGRNQGSLVKFNF
jgi:hypothetical protein